MSNNEKIENNKKKIIIVKCSVKNCEKKISIDEAIKINDQYFCGICGVAYYRSTLNI